MYKKVPTLGSRKLSKPNFRPFQLAYCLLEIGIKLGSGPSSSLPLNYFEPPLPLDLGGAQKNFNFFFKILQSSLNVRRQFLEVSWTDPWFLYMRSLNQGQI